MNHSTIGLLYPCLSSQLETNLLDPNDSFHAFNQYAAVGSFSILTWDILNFAIQDYQLLSAHKPTILTILSLTSRISALINEIFSVLLLTSLSGPCVLYLTASAAFYFVHRICTNALFYARVHGVYRMQPLVIRCFQCLWFMSLGGAAMVFLGSHSSHRTEKNACPLRVDGPYLLVAIVSDGLFELLVCIAVTYRIGSDRSDSPRRTLWKRVLGRGE
ncbi:hypothetical protein CPB83DRAFT_429270 [Crepidotus variabilis]|uniref:Uncharacterized protein n=1 Tax=Crepidotus variabilis TaxID=179855 RepID=A0A9P6EDG5_9AGAR|nr:hypothetical protein CPB83DRAFT_429270 [Crepidotus variabilis]